MLSFTRRQVLRLGAALGLLPASAYVAGCGDGDAAGLPEYEFDGAPGPEDLFQHAVASGDPLPDRVILWTRVTPEARAEAVEVFWEMARDPAFAERVAAGWTSADAARDFTVKVDAGTLRAGTTYFYRFRALGRTSPTGRTRTAPDGPAEQLRFGVVSCSGYGFGYFHAYRGLAERADLDAVLHLGDYIYEYAGGLPGREHEPPHEIVTLDDYRGRYSQYRRDPDLQAAHMQHPFIVVWDDHESANNSYRDGAENHQPESEGEWAERRARAAQAYSEWLPIRDQDDGRIFRTLRFGELIDLVMLDTRIWGRDPQPERGTDVDVVRDPARTLLGFDQEEWLAAQVRASSAQWFVLGQQVVMTQWKLQGLPESQGGGGIGNVDAWDGYHATRVRFFEAVREAGLRNLVVLAGDVHSSWASDLTEDPNEPTHYDPVTGRGSLGVELVAPGATSVFPAPGVEALFLSQNPAIKYGETAHQGYFVLDVDRSRAEASWYHLDDVTRPETVERLAAAFTTRDGENHLEPV